MEKRVELIDKTQINRKKCEKIHLQENQLKKLSLLNK